ncbi:hypothetical protein VCUG_01143 [Vavraia culicis subsp. floridensis]|uniref:CSN8/PSMD8/EIF3K domain-containing protein n=1 Tax=Vavraia culicis (isolate floridensis) TaxID=948595 RepID=L2GUT9_VAVCU|nr:uncharacterized protein VCUG_01143 [Vavraia culicis subsp. floridensis]ELA47374.1 hypothetical protein VCUG_01143 [Vavraia culicis subsp. floridensis]
MKTSEIENIENKCIESMRNNDLEQFQYNFNMVKHQYNTTKTSVSTFVKACELMILLSTDFLAYLYFLETLDYEDINNEHIMFVLGIERLMTEENVALINQQLGKYKEWDGCIRSIIKALESKDSRFKMEQINVAAEPAEHSPLQTIKDCILFSKNFNKI